MNGNEEKTRHTDQIKQKIRERYKGVSEDILDVIPATPQEDFYKPDTVKRVAVYARVSTDDPNQTSSYELQKNHYEDKEDFVLRLSDVIFPVYQSAVNCGFHKWEYVNG